MTANFSHAKVNSSMTLESKDSSKLQSFFGGLKKEEVAVQKLLRDTKDRLVSHLLPPSCPVQSGTSGLH